VFAKDLSLFSADMAGSALMWASWVWGERRQLGPGASTAWMQTLWKRSVLHRGRTRERKTSSSI